MSQGGGAKSPANLIDTTLADLDLAWVEREVEAAVLLRAGFGSISLSLRLYALEMRLKAEICRRLALAALPKACKTHDLSELVIFTGLWSELEDPSGVAIRQNWDLLVDFSKKRLNDLRYQPRASLDDAYRDKLLRALDDPIEGVSSWLSRPR